MDSTEVNFSNSERLLDNLSNFFATLCNEGVINVIPYAEYMICVFCIIDLAMSWWLYEGELRFPALIQKILKMGAFLYMIYNWPMIMGLIGKSFEFIGFLAAGNTAEEANALINQAQLGDGTATMFSPSKIWDKFGDITSAYVESMSHFTVWDMGKLFGLFLAYIVTLLGFLFMTIQLFLTITEFSVFTVIAVVLLPFGCLSYTSFLSQRAISGAFSYGIKLMVLYFLLGCISKLTDKFIKASVATDGNNFGDPLSIGLAYLVIGYLVMKVPDLVQSMMSGTPNLGNSVTPAGMASAAYAPFKQRGGGGGGGTYSYAGAAVRAAAMGAGAVGSVVAGRASNIAAAAGQARAKGGSLGAQVARGTGYWLGREGNQAIGAIGKGGKTVFKATGGRLLSAANQNLAKPASKTFGNAMNRQDSEINTGRKVSNATAKAANAAWSALRNFTGF